MKLFIPEIVYVDPRVLKIESAKKTLEYLKKMNIPIVSTRTVLIDGLSPIENYVKAKKTILLTINAQKIIKNLSTLSRLSV